MAIENVLRRRAASSGGGGIGGIIGTGLGGVIGTIIPGVGTAGGAALGGSAGGAIGGLVDPGSAGGNTPGPNPLGAVKPPSINPIERRQQNGADTANRLLQTGVGIAGAVGRSAGGNAPPAIDVENTTPPMELPASNDNASKLKDSLLALQNAPQEIQSKYAVPLMQAHMMAMRGMV